MSIDEGILRQMPSSSLPEARCSKYPLERSFYCLLKLKRETVVLEEEVLYISTSNLSQATGK